MIELLGVSIQGGQRLIDGLLRLTKLATGWNKVIGPFVLSLNCCTEMT